jgi:hypothetical protein
MQRRRGQMAEAVQVYGRKVRLRRDHVVCVAYG